MESIAFSIEEYDGLVITEGLLHWTAEGLQLEYQKKDGLFGIFKSTIRETSIPLADLLELSYKKKTLNGQVRLRTRRMASLSQVPGNKQGEVVLNIARKNRQDAETLALQATLAISEHQLDIIDKRQAPPGLEA